MNAKHAQFYRLKFHLINEINTHMYVLIEIKILSLNSRYFYVSVEIITAISFKV